MAAVVVNFVDLAIALEQAPVEGLYFLVLDELGELRGFRSDHKQQGIIPKYLQSLHLVLFVQNRRFHVEFLYFPFQLAHDATHVLHVFVPGYLHVVIQDQIEYECENVPYLLDLAEPAMTLQWRQGEGFFQPGQDSAEVIDNPNNQLGVAVDDVGVATPEHFIHIDYACNPHPVVFLAN